MTAPSGTPGTSGPNIQPRTANLDHSRVHNSKAAFALSLFRRVAAGEIALLPALPKAWPTGSVKGLRARGGMEVDMDWQDGRAVKAVLRATLDRRLALRPPVGQPIAAMTIAGAPAVTKAGGHGTVAVVLKAGQTCAVSFR